MTIEPTTTLEKAVTAETRFFSGAKEKQFLDRYENEGITSLSKSIDWGWFELLTKPMFYLLDFLKGLVGNFGIALGWAAFAPHWRPALVPIASTRSSSQCSSRS